MKLATYNIRVQTISDFGLKNWIFRKAGIKKIVEKHNLDFLCVQEINRYAHLLSLMLLFPKFKIYSYGRDNNFGERLGILYNPTKFKLLDSGHIKLPAMSEKLQDDWSDWNNRICIWVKLLDLQSYEYIYVLNSHFASASEMHDTAVVEVLNLAKSFGDDAKVVFCGDLNMRFVNNEPAYNKLTEYFDDANVKSKAIINGHIGTGCDFSNEIPPLFRRIDYVFARNMELLSCETDTTLHNDTFPSDHLPIITEMK